MARRRADLSLDRRTLLKTFGAATLLGAIPARRGGGAGRQPTYPVTFPGMPGDGPGRRASASAPRPPPTRRRSGA